MSRTFRHIPWHCRYVQSWRKTWAYLYNDPIVWDDKHRLDNGYDGVQQSAIRVAKRGWWDDTYTGSTRRFYKRYIGKIRRLDGKREIKQQLNE